MKLKPCPFCGSYDTETSGAKVGARHVECYECGAWVPYLIWQQRTTLIYCNAPLLMIYPSGATLVRQI